MDRLLHVTRVDVRYNADLGNAADFGAFLDFVEARGWLDAPCPCVDLVAKVAAYFERSLFMRRRELGSDEFAALEAIARDRLPPPQEDHV